MSDLEPLDPSLRDLLSLESGAYAEDTFARDAVLRRIQAAIVLAPLVAGGSASAATAAAATAGAGSASAKVVAAVGWKSAAIAAVVAFGGGVAVGEVHQAMTSRVPTVVAPAPVASSTPTLQPPTVTPDDLPKAEPSATPLAASSVASTATPSPTPRSAMADPADERAAIDTARTALARGRPADALVAIDDHSRRFPTGRLAEEREALAVQALALAGDGNRALSRATRFRRSYPNSIFGSAVDRAVAPFERDARP